jgi:hypothetical protein
LFNNLFCHVIFINRYFKKQLGSGNSKCVLQKSLYRDWVIKFIPLGEKGTTEYEDKLNLFQKNFSIVHFIPVIECCRGKKYT